MGLHRHHLTGRPAPETPYLDPGLVVELPHREHVSLHVALRALDLEFPAPAVDLLAYRRRRAAVQFRLRAVAGETTTLSPDAGFGLADLLDGGDG